MTKEGLGKEAVNEAEELKEYQTAPKNEYEKGFNNGEIRGFKDGYIAGAEPREKQIEIDVEQIRALQKQNGELTDKVKELEKEKDVMRRKADEAIADKLLITAKYNEILNSLNQEKDNLQKKNAELEKQLEEADNATDCFNRQEEIIEKAKGIIKELMKMPILLVAEETKTEAEIEELFKQAEDFIKEIE